MRRSVLTRPVIGLVIALVAVGSLIGASASGLGLSPRSLLGLRQTDVVAGPPIVTCDNFSGNGSMNGRAVQTSARCGSFTWAVHTGTAQTTGGQARTNGVNATVTVAAGSLSRDARVDIRNAGGGSDIAGLALAHNGSTTTPRYLGVALVGSASVQVRLVNGTTVSTIASASATITSSTALRASLSSGVVRVWVNGSLRITYALTSAQLSTISAGTRYGIYDSGGSGRYDDFMLTQVWP